MWLSCGRKLLKNVDLDEPTSFLDHGKPNEIIEEEHTKMFESRNFCWSNWIVTRVGKASRNNSRMVLRHGRTCSKMRWAVLWFGKQEKWSSCTKFQLLAWITTNSRKKNLYQSENYHKFAHKVFWNALYLARIGSPDIHWSVNKLARAVTKSTQACDRRLAILKDGEKCGYWRTHFISFLTTKTWDVLNVNANWMKSLRRGRYTNFWLTFFCWSNCKFYKGVKSRT